MLPPSTLRTFALQRLGERKRADKHALTITPNGTGYDIFSRGGTFVGTVPDLTTLAEALTHHQFHPEDFDPLGPYTAAATEQKTAVAKILHAPNPPQPETDFGF